jgi:hypothetical protein
VVEIIVSYLEKSDHKELKITDSYYWDLASPEDIYNPYKNPKKELSLGDLYEDWDFLQNVLSGEHEPIGYHLTKLAPILNNFGMRNMA